MKMGSKCSRDKQQCETGSESLSQPQDTFIAEKLPHNYHAILKDADEDFDIDKYSSMPTELLYKQLEDGVFLKQKR